MNTRLSLVTNCFHFAYSILRSYIEYRNILLLPYLEHYDEVELRIAIFSLLYSILSGVSYEHLINKISK